MKTPHDVKVQLVQLDARVKTLKSLSKMKQAELAPDIIKDLIHTTHTLASCVDLLSAYVKPEAESV